MRWLETKCIYSEEIDSLIRFASIFKLKELMASIDRFAEENVEVQAIPIEMEELFRQLNFVSEYNLDKLKKFCVNRFIASLHTPEGEGQIAKLIARIEHDQLPDLLFGEEGLFPPVWLTTADGKIKAKVNFGKLCCLSRVLRTAIGDVKEVPTDVNFFSLPHCSQGLLDRFVQMLSDGKSEIKKEDCLDLFLLADELDIPFLYEDCLDLLKKIIDESSEWGEEYRNFLDQFLTRLPGDLKPSIVEKLESVRNYMYYFNLDNLKESQGWIDFSIRHNLGKKNIIEKIAREMWMKISNAIYSKKTIRWPKNLEYLPPMDFPGDLNKDLLKKIKVKDLEGLNLRSLDLREMIDISKEDLHELVKMFPNLKELKFRWCSGLDIQDLLILAPLPLYHLEISHLELRFPFSKIERMRWDAFEKGCIAFINELCRVHKFDYIYLKVNDTRVHTPPSLLGKDLELRNGCSNRDFKNILKGGRVRDMYLRFEDQIELFFLARDLKLSSAYEAFLDHFIELLCSPSLKYFQEAIFYHQMVKLVLPFLPLHCKTAIIKEIDKKAIAYIQNPNPKSCYYQGHFDCWEEVVAWVDFSVEHDLVEANKGLVEYVKDSIEKRSRLCFDKIKENVKEGKPVEWPKSFMGLPPMDLNLDFGSLKGAKITDFKGLNLKHLQIQGDIDDKGLEALVQQFPNLCDLTISSPNITRFGLLALTVLPLHRLDLSVPSMKKEDGIAFLEELRKLDKVHYLEFRLNSEQIRAAVPWSKQSQG